MTSPERSVSRLTAAHDVREWQPAYVLNLLRTPEYAAAARATTGPVDGAAERRAAAERRDFLADPTRSARLLMSEAALRWRLGNRALMVDQVRHLRDVARLPNVHLGIVPLDARADFVIGHAFHIYDREAVVVGTFHTSMTITDPAVVRSYLSLHDRLDGLVLRGGQLDDLLAGLQAVLTA